MSAAQNSLRRAATQGVEKNRLFDRRLRVGGVIERNEHAWINAISNGVVFLGNVIEANYSAASAPT